MRICRVALSYPTTKSPGAGLVAWYLCRYMPEPTLYVTYKLDGDLVPAPDNVELAAIEAPPERSSSSLNRQLHAGRLNAFQRAVVYLKLAVSGRSVKFLARSILRIARFRPDLICCHANVTLYHGVFFHLLFRIPFVLHVHAVSDAIAIRNLPVLRWMVERAVRVYAISQGVLDELARVLPRERLRLTSTGVDPEVFRNLGSPRPKRIIQVGQLMWYKGHKHLLEAMPAILARHPDCELVIVGSGQLREEIEKRVADLGIGESVRMVPRMSHPELRELYNESRLLLMPSLYEGLPKVLLEAFACGLPAVITDACNAADISVGRAEVVPKGDPAALADAVCALLDDSARWEDWSRRCEGIVGTHDWRLVSERVQADYRDALGVESRPSESHSFQPGLQVP